MTEKMSGWGGIGALEQMAFDRLHGKESPWRMAYIQMSKDKKYETFYYNTANAERIDDAMTTEWNTRPPVYSAALREKRKLHEEWLKEQAKLEKERKKRLKR